jgi:glycerate-2-kinase
MSYIKNPDTFSATNLRADAYQILEAGYTAIDTRTVIRERIHIDGETLRIMDKTFDMSAYERLLVVAFGKCAAEASVELESILGNRITEGIVIDIRSGIPLRHLSFLAGTHPLPSDQNIAATEHVASLLSGATEKDLIIVIVSGGGSSMLCLPSDLSCGALAHVTDTLMKAGATIEEINTVRKHTSKIQGGQLAALAYPATLVSCIFSDVPGDDIGMIASGPTVLDTTTKEDAAAILAKYDILRTCALPHCELVETPKDEHTFARVTNVLILTNRTMLVAMRKKAEELGYQSFIAHTAIQGEARDVGRRIVDEAVRGKTCMVYGGETTVTVLPDEETGTGGRAQEVALSALCAMDEQNKTDGMLVVGIASDGWDNTDVAGAVVDGLSVLLAPVFAGSPKMYLSRHDAYGFFERTGDHIVTGRTGANVSDVYMILTE